MVDLEFGNAEIKKFCWTKKKLLAEMWHKKRGEDTRGTLNNFFKIEFWYISVFISGPLFIRSNP